jgi:hypothetical protein
MWNTLMVIFTTGYLFRLSSQVNIAAVESPDKKRPITGAKYIRSTKPRHLNADHNVDARCRR